MRIAFLICCLSVFNLASFAQADNPKYNKALADSLGADDYGMKSYVLAILKTGSYKTDKKEVLDSLFRGHMNNMGRLVADNKLIVAGPLGKNDREYRGIFILNVKTVEEAKALVATDPAIGAKLFDVELYPWYGSAALPEYLKAHEKIEKKKH
jgi:uncharacterized protein YciI